jgi:hypothetical protein
MFSLNVDRAPSAPVPFESPSPKLRNVQCAKRHPARSLCLSANTSSSELPAICILITCLASVHAVQGSSEVIKLTIAERSYLRLAIGDAIGGDGDAHRHGSGRGMDAKGGDRVSGFVSEIVVALRCCAGSWEPAPRKHNIEDEDEDNRQVLLR